MSPKEIDSDLVIKALMNSDVIEDMEFYRAVMDGAREAANKGTEEI